MMERPPEKSPLQFLILPHVGMFRLGESVFIKSNPEIPMVVTGRNNVYVRCKWSFDGRVHEEWFPPETILPYYMRCFQMHFFGDMIFLHCWN